MKDPVMMSGDDSGHSYERRAAEAWLRSHSTSPITGTPLESKTLVPNWALKNLIDSMRQPG